MTMKKLTTILLFQLYAALVIAQTPNTVNLDHIRNSIERNDSCTDSLIRAVILISESPETTDSLKVVIAFALAKAMKPLAIQYLIDHIEIMLFTRDLAPEGEILPYLYSLLGIALKDHERWWLFYQILDALSAKERNDSQLEGLSDVLKTITGDARVLLNGELLKCANRNKKVYEKNLQRLITVWD